jgi:N5-(carboxyethyl)ornithine synthase
MKLIQPSDYDKLREGQMIIGWTHPTGSGTKFMIEQAIPKKLIIVDLDNIFPAVYYMRKKYPIDFIKPYFIWKNSYNAGLCAVYHAVLAHGILPDSNTKVAVLSIGNVSQGAIASISKFNTNTRIFYRKTMHLFYDTLEEYDIIISGIEVEDPNNHILTFEHQKRLKRGCFIIDAAADAGNTIEGTHYTTIADPIYEDRGLFFYEVNNAPSILFRETSKWISESFSKVVYNFDIQKYYNIIG